jgi:hypothetical protein
MAEWQCGGIECHSAERTNAPREPWFPRNCRTGRPINGPCMHIALRWLHHAHRSSVLPATLQAAYLWCMPQSPQVADTAPDEPFLTGYDMAHSCYVSAVARRRRGRCRLAGGGRDCPRARRGKGPQAGQAVMGEPSRAGQMDDRERLSLSPPRRAAELSTQSAATRET